MGYYKTYKTAHSVLDWSCSPDGRVGTGGRLKKAGVYSGRLAAWGLPRAQGKELSCRGNGEQQAIASFSAGGA
ncbi:hypothetical protein MHYP_G00154410 [Metynnis hypsauchen]